MLAAPLKQLGGPNKVLLEAQIKAIYKYMEDLYLSGYGAVEATKIPLQNVPSCFLIVSKPGLVFEVVGPSSIAF